MTPSPNVEQNPPPITPILTQIQNINTIHTTPTFHLRNTTGLSLLIQQLVGKLIHDTEISIMHEDTCEFFQILSFHFCIYYWVHSILCVYACSVYWAFVSISIMFHVDAFIGSCCVMVWFLNVFPECAGICVGRVWDYLSCTLGIWACKGVLWLSLIWI